jgi:alpha-tubulin suppressor-like RCC1 family protein
MEKTSKIKFIPSFSSLLSASFMLDLKNEVYNCGRNDNSQLLKQSSSKFIETGINVELLSAGYSFIIYKTKDKKIYINGLFFMNKPTKVLIPLSPQLNVQFITSGMDHCLLIDINGICYSCGRNSSGELGLGTEQDLITEFLPINHKEKFKFASCGSSFSIFLTFDGEVYSCGINTLGELGIGKEGDKSITLKQVIKNDSKPLNDIVYLSSGRNHTLALDKYGSIYSWGINNDGQLGLNNIERKYSANRIDLLIKFISIASGWSHNYAIDKNNQMYSWGKNSSAQLGFEYEGFIKTPTLITSLADVAHIYAGNSHGFAKTLNGKIYCIGYNGYSQLGNNTKDSVLKPTLINSYLPKELSFPLLIPLKKEKNFFKFKKYLKNIFLKDCIDKNLDGKLAIKVFTETYSNGISFELKTIFYDLNWIKINCENFEKSLSNINNLIQNLEIDQKASFYDGVYNSLHYFYGERNFSLKIHKCTFRESKHCVKISSYCIICFEEVDKLFQTLYISDILDIKGLKYLIHQTFNKIELSDALLFELLLKYQKISPIFETIIAKCLENRWEPKTSTFDKLPRECERMFMRRSKCPIDLGLNIDNFQNNFEKWYSQNFHLTGFNVHFKDSKDKKEIISIHRWIIYKWDYLNSKLNDNPIEFNTPLEKNHLLFLIYYICFGKVEKNLIENFDFTFFESIKNLKSDNLLPLLDYHNHNHQLNPDLNNCISILNSLFPKSLQSSTFKQFQDFAIENFQVLSITENYINSQDKLKIHLLTIHTLQLNEKINQFNIFKKKMEEKFSISS